MTAPMTTEIVWNSFLQGAPEDSKQLLTGALTDDLANSLSSLPILPLSQISSILSWEEGLELIHYSWFCPFLRTLPEKEIKLFLAALVPEQAKGLKQALLLSNTLPTLSGISVQYLRKTLWKVVGEEDLIPCELLPSNPLNALLSLSSDQLYSIIDLLAMYDLSGEIRHIIDTVKLKEIHAILSKPQLAFLKTLLHQKEAIAFKRMGLNNWEKDHEILHSLLEQRGINRLAKALYPCHQSLRWHIAHRLDMEKGQQLLKLATPLNHEKAYGILAEEILALVASIQEQLPKRGDA